MRIIRIYVGEGFHTQRFIESALKADVIGGATVTPSIGWWTDDSGTVVHEKSEVITLAISNANIKAVVTFANEWREFKTNEDSIMFEHDGRVGFDELP